MYGNKHSEMKLKQEKQCLTDDLTDETDEN